MKSSTKSHSSRQTITVVQLNLLKHLADHRLDLAEKDLQAGATLTPKEGNHETELWKAVIKKERLAPQEKVDALNWMVDHGAPAHRAMEAGLMPHVLRNQPREVWDWMTMQATSQPFRLATLDDGSLSAWIKASIQCIQPRAMQWLTEHQMAECLIHRPALRKLAANSINEALVEHGVNAAGHLRGLIDWGVRMEHMTDTAPYGALVNPLFHLIKFMPDLSAPDMAASDTRQCLEKFEQTWDVLIQLGANPEAEGRFNPDPAKGFVPMTPAEALIQAPHTQASVSLHRADDALAMAPPRSRTRLRT